MWLLAVIVVCGLFFTLWLAWPCPPPDHFSWQDDSYTASQWRIAAQQEREQQ